MQLRRGLGFGQAGMALGGATWPRRTARRGVQVHLLDAEVLVGHRIGVKGRFRAPLGLRDHNVMRVVRGPADAGGVRPFWRASLLRMMGHGRRRFAVRGRFTGFSHHLFALHRTAVQAFPVRLARFSPRASVHPWRGNSGRRARGVRRRGQRLRRRYGLDHGPRGR